MSAEPEPGSSLPRAGKGPDGDRGTPEDRQIVVVGAGPAGSTAARYAAEAGADVLLIDRRTIIGKPVQCAGYLPTLGELAEMLPDVPDHDELYHIDDSFVLARTYQSVMVSPKGRKKTLRFEWSARKPLVSLPKA